MKRKRRDDRPLLTSHYVTSLHDFNTLTSLHDFNTLTIARLNIKRLKIKKSKMKIQKHFSQNAHQEKKEKKETRGRLTDNYSLH
jgi:hypothetical protein